MAVRTINADALLETSEVEDVNISNILYTIDEENLPTRRMRIVEAKRKSRMGRNLLAPLMNGQQLTSHHLVFLETENDPPQKNLP